MLLDAEALAALPGFRGAIVRDVEPLGLALGAPEHVILEVAGERRDVLLRRPGDPDRAANNIAVLEALGRAGFDAAPRLLGRAGDTAVETWHDGLTALAVEPSSAQLEAVVDALATLHGLPIREGLRWGEPPASLLPGPDFPLHRLGYAAHERDAARPAFAAASEALLTTPWGFCHGWTEASRVIFAGKPPCVLLDWEGAGFGPQLHDLAAFLATAVVEPAHRAALAARYASARGLGDAPWVDLADLATLTWGLDFLLGVPRRLVQVLGDDGAVAGLRLAISRVEAAFRAPAGSHPAAVALRHTLWPA
jgi:aminoglycoside phosphotransferase (APT) family kinase protein